MASLRRRLWDLRRILAPATTTRRRVPATFHRDVVSSMRENGARLLRTAPFALILLPSLAHAGTAPGAAPESVLDLIPLLIAVTVSGLGSLLLLGGRRRRRRVSERRMWLGVLLLVGGVAIAVLLIVERSTSLNPGR